MDDKRTKAAMDLYQALGRLIHEGNGTSGVCVSAMGSIDVIYAIINLIDERIAKAEQSRWR
jgi:predicted proteasome-type protease